MDNWISRNNSNILRGITALVIMYVHLGYTVANEENFLIILSPLGYLCVGIFYFYTGYNLLATIERKGTKGFVISKLKRIYAPFVLANILYILFLCFEGEYNYSIRGLIYSIVGLRLANDTLWYVISILWYQALFFLIYRGCEILFKGKSTSPKICFFVMIVAFIIYTLSYPKVANITGALQGYTEVYPLSIIAGAWLRLNEKKIYGFVKSYKIQISFIILFFLCICFKESKILFDIDICNVMAPVLAALFVNVLLCGEEIQGEYGILLGSISYEVYLLHKPILLLLRGRNIYIENIVIYVFVYSIVLWTCAYILNKKWGKRKIGNLSK